MSDKKQLIDNVKKGDTRSFRELYLLYARYLSAICRRYISDEDDAKDVLQEAFVKIWSSIASFNYRGEGSLKAWMSRIVVNHSLRFLLRNKKLHFENIEKTDLPQEEVDVETEQIPTDVLFELIRSLPDGYRTVFNLFVVEGKNHKEIAALMGIKENTSASQLFKAKAMLAEKIRQWTNTTGQKI